MRGCCCTDKNNYNELAQIRLERALELLVEAEVLLNEGHYKSANNRAYYCVEKCLNALLAIRGVQTLTHSGCLKQFNMIYIHGGDGTFTSNDYSVASQMEHIRNASDYDDFYLASKSETVTQVTNARYMYLKIKEYIESQI